MFSRSSTTVSYVYFRSYLQGGDAKAVTERVTLLEKFTGRDMGDISKIVTAGQANHQHLLISLYKRFQMLSDLEIVDLIERRLLHLVNFNIIL